MYKRQLQYPADCPAIGPGHYAGQIAAAGLPYPLPRLTITCLLYTSDAADERSSVDLGGRRIIKKKTQITVGNRWEYKHKKHKSRRDRIRERIDI